MRHQVVRFGLAETLLHCTFNAHQTGTELVFSQFADTTHATITEVIDIIDFAATVAQFDQDLNNRKHVFIRQRHCAGQFIAADTAIEFHAAHSRQVITLFAIEQSVEQRLDRILGRRFARTHHAVDRDACRHLVGCIVHAQSLRNITALVQVVGIQRLDVGYVCFAQPTQQVICQFVVRVGNHFTCVGINDIFREYAAKQIVFRNRDMLDASGLDFTHMLGVDALVFGDDDLARLVADVEAGNRTAQTFSDEFHFGAFRTQCEIIEDEEIRKNLLRRHADCLEQNRYRHLATAVDAEIQDVLRIEFEVEP